MLAKTRIVLTRQLNGNRCARHVEARRRRKIGVAIIRRALEEPARQIANNAGVEGSIIVEQIKATGKGYNAATGEFGDLAEQGIVDPAKVTRSALQNAASIAGMILTTETLVAERPEKPGPAPAGGGGGMPGMGG